jgi:hypothetical protein
MLTPPGTSFSLRMMRLIRSCDTQARPRPYASRSAWDTLLLPEPEYPRRTMSVVWSEPTVMPVSLPRLAPASRPPRRRWASATASGRSDRYSSVSSYPGWPVRLAISSPIARRYAARSAWLSRPARRARLRSGSGKSDRHRTKAHPFRFAARMSSVVRFRWLVGTTAERSQIGVPGNLCRCAGYQKCPARCGARSTRRHDMWCLDLLDHLHMVLPQLVPRALQVRGGKREPGVTPGLPRSGERERPPSGAAR